MKQLIKRIKQRFFKQPEPDILFYGGAWKVAYADFVTAMMAFFLLMWLLNVTTQEQRDAISNYFDPTHPRVSESTSGAGGVMGGLSVAPEGAMIDNVQPITPVVNKNNMAPAKTNKLEEAKEILRKKEEDTFEKKKREIEKAIAEDPELKELSNNLLIDVTREGLRIQIVDQDGEAMFASGSAQMVQKTRELMTKLAGIIKDLPNELSIRGHTDSVPFGPDADYTNWELSSDRANASRRAFLEEGIPADRVNNVVGKADTEPLIAEDTEDPRNRRISIILLREELTNPDFEKQAEEIAAEMPDASSEEGENDGASTNEEGALPSVQDVPIGTFRKTPGAVEFP